MRLLEVLKKYVGPTVVGTLTIDGYRRTVYYHKKEIETFNENNTALLNAAKAQTNELENKLENTTRLAAAPAIGKQEERFNHINADLVRYLASGTSAQEREVNMNKVENKIEVLNSKIEYNQFGPGETKESTKTMISHFSNELKTLNNTKNIESKELLLRKRDYIENIKKSDVFDWFSDFIENYKQFVDTLSSDQLVALYNIIGYFMIFNALTSIGIILLGNTLIERWDLEAKYPRFSKLIKGRAQLSKAYLWLHVIILFSLIFINIGVNIYMFSLRFFI